MSEAILSLALATAAALLFGWSLIIVVSIIGKDR